MKQIAYNLDCMKYMATVPDKYFDLAEVPASSSGEHTKSRENKVEKQGVGYNFEIPTLGKKTARFYIPDGVTEKDLDYIKLYIENMLPVFLENLKSEIKQE